MTIGPADRSQPDARFAYNIVSPDYFETLRIRLVAGRSFAPNDDRRAPDVVVVSRAMARRLFQTENAVGRSVRVVDRAGRARTATVVGVVRDIKMRSLGEAASPVAYLPFGQWYRPDMVLHVRVAANADQVIPRVVEQIHMIEPDLALEEQTLTRATEFSMIPLRVATVVLGFCGVVGALLAALGVFGLVAYAVSLRAREIGIRVALGADRGAVVRLIGRHGLSPVAIGLVVGLLLVALLGGAVRAILVGVTPTDLVSLGASALLLFGAALVALVAPLRRALAVDPVAVLRSE